jgi:uncharacterized protein (TIGR04222 family)
MTMNTLIADSTWGISGPTFLATYGSVCAVAALDVGRRWLALLGPAAPPDNGELPDLGLYELAALGDGPQLAITSAAAQLHRDGRITSSLAGGAGTLEAAGELDDSADPVERAVFEIVRAEPGIAAQAMRERAAQSDAVQAMVAELTQGQLLIEPDRAVALARRILIVGAVLALAGIERMVAGALNGAPVLGLVVAVGGLAFAAVWAAGRVPVATRRGRAQLQRWRHAHEDLKRNPIGGECALAAALFGGAVLWIAAPDIASALGVERESSSLGNGGGGGGCGGGCGGCGGCGG